MDTRRGHIRMTKLDRGIEWQSETRTARSMESGDIRHIGSIPLRFAPVPRFASLWQPCTPSLDPYGHTRARLWLTPGIGAELPGIYRIISRWLRGSHSGGYQCPRPSASPSPKSSPSGKRVPTIQPCLQPAFLSTSLAHPISLSFFNVSLSIRLLPSSVYLPIHLSICPSIGLPQPNLPSSPLYA